MTLFIGLACVFSCGTGGPPFAGGAKTVGDRNAEAPTGTNPTDTRQTSDPTRPEGGELESRAEQKAHEDAETGQGQSEKTEPGPDVAVVFVEPTEPRPPANGDDSASDMRDADEPEHNRRSRGRERRRSGHGVPPQARPGGTLAGGNDGGAGGTYDPYVERADKGGVDQQPKYDRPKEERRRRRSDKTGSGSTATTPTGPQTTSLGTANTGTTTRPAVTTPAPVEQPQQTTAERPEQPRGAPVQTWKDKEGFTAFEMESKKLGPVYTEPGDLPHLEVVFGDDIEIEEIMREYGRDIVVEGNVRVPLEHTHVDAKLAGPVARVHVQQRYGNPFERPIEAIYVFPLPENSAVDGMRMVIGERVIEGVIMERKAARQVYEQAKAEGHTTALLEQERPNVFTQSVANIPPGQRVNIDVRYVQDLTYDAGGYEFVFPMVVGPRYVPGAIGDLARINPPVMGAGTRSGHDISLALSADAGVPIRSYEVPTHDVTGGIDAFGRLSMRLADHEDIPNRDFVLRYAVAGDEAQVAVMSEKLEKNGEGFFSLIVQPPDIDVNALVGTRQVIFVVDVSGSMAGVPVAMSREAMVESLRRLRPVDTFNIVTFASGTTRLFDRPLPASRNNIERGTEFVGAMESGGGTRMMGGIVEALEGDIEPGVQRVVIFMTDGFIGNESEIISEVGKRIEQIEEQKAKARVFAMGVGSSTNRYLIDGLAKEGGGAAMYALNREDPRGAVDAFFAIIDHPIYTDVEIDFGDLDVDLENIYPPSIPDLMASRPIVVHGRYRKAGKGKAVLKARARGKMVEIPFEVNLSKNEEHDGVLGTLWARSAVEALERDMLYSSDYDGLRAKIIQLATTHSIVTTFTSFVAVDAEIVEGGGNPLKVEQPVQSPEDTIER